MTPDELAERVEELAGRPLKPDEARRGYILQKDERGRFWQVGYAGSGLSLTLESDPTQEVYFEAFPFRALMQLFEDAMEDEALREDRRVAINMKGES